MIFPFEIIINTDLEKYKTYIKDKLNIKKQGNFYKVKFFRRLLFIWYWGDFELTAENHQGKDYYVRRHILTIAYIKKTKEKTLLKGINIVNILDYFTWFLLPFALSVYDGNILGGFLFSVAITILAAAGLAFDKDKTASDILVSRLQDKSE